MASVPAGCVLEVVREPSRRRTADKIVRDPKRGIAEFGPIGKFYEGSRKWNGTRRHKWGPV